MIHSVGKHAKKIQHEDRPARDIDILMALDRTPLTPAPTLSVESYFCPSVFRRAQSASTIAPSCRFRPCPLMAVCHRDRQQITSVFQGHSRRLPTALRCRLSVASPSLLRRNQPRTPPTYLGVGRVCRSHCRLRTRKRSCPESVCS
jgi:hypothetical protein